MPLSVVHVVPSFSGGGAERQLVLLTSALVDAGVEVHLAHLHEGPNIVGARRSGAHLYRVSAFGNHDPAVLGRLLSLFRDLRPSIVQTWLLHSDLFGGLAARLAGVPWILSERSSGAMYEHGAKFRLRRWFGLRADAIVANSEGGAQYWRNAGFDGNLLVVRNIVDRRISTIALRRDRRLLAIGRLSEEKNYPMVFTALSLLLQHAPDVRLDILGEGHLRTPLQQQLNANPVLRGAVNLLGHVDDVTPYLDNAAALVSLSRYEGTPNVVLEAMARGCPLVLSDIGAHRELLDERCAKFISLDAEPGVIASALESLLSDPSAALRQAEAAAERLDAWTPGRIAGLYLDLYRTLATDR